MSHIEPVIRPARECDADVIARLHAESLRSTARGIVSDAFLDDAVYAERRQAWRTRLAQADAPFLTLVAVQRDGLHGFISFELDADARWGTLLDCMHVDPELCGRGLGESLMRVGVLQVEQARPEDGLHLLVFEGNTGARRFYERLGGRNHECVDVPLPDGSGLTRAVRYVWPAPVVLRKP